MKTAMFFILTALKWLVVPALFLVLALAAFLKFAPVFGAAPDAASKAKIEQASNFNGSVFTNLRPTSMENDEREKPSLLKWLSSSLNPPEGKHPAEPLPSERLDANALADGSITWLGHSTVLVKTAGKTLLFDPVFHRASPVFLTGKPFATTNPPKLADLPPIDAILISHDHYDHLDYRTITAIHAKVGHFFVPLGVKAHLQRWGVAEEKITELGWYEAAQLGALRFTLTPSRHFSSRRLSNRDSTLWGGWVLKAPALSLFFSGDSGYDPEFAKIGEQFGPFDIACIENGTYDLQWPQIHMLPEEGVQAALDLRAHRVLPIHWAKFDLAYHTWKDPVERFTLAARGKNLQVATPKIGQSFTLDRLPQEPWWEDVK